MAVTSAGRNATDEPAEIGQTIKIGVTAGVVAAIVMAMYAMIAGATYLGSGFFTPLYHIASTFIDPKAMMTSMEKAMSGESSFYFSFGPALVGMMVHLATGAAFGAIFALLARALGLRGGVAAITGAIYGVVVMLFSSYVALPIVASVFGGGDAISGMAQMVGWTTFTIEHLMFGLVVGLGWVLATRGAEEREFMRSDAVHA